ncbi:MAG: KpsF/GutQ family sugar-phosphate isomerase [Planctomycetota bacterium]|nr:KpsF/GutQ family sugar-phosphate isomerase [Planctomycetota bacterium]
MPKKPHEIGADVVAGERDALDGLLARMPALAESFDRAVELMLECQGRVIVCGMGKSGQIGRKLASTLVSTGTPASFLHPAEGFHGDVGLVTSRDVVLAISNSGSTREVIELVPVMRNLGAKIIALTGNDQSPLAKASEVALCWGEIREADPTGLVPTVSAALTLALGDALTVALMEQRGFGMGDYRLFHPSGAIGTKLTLRVVDLLRGEHTNPCVRAEASFAETLDVVTRNTQGGVNVVDENHKLVGILTDGDVRRTMQVASGSVSDLLARPVSELMTREPTSVTARALAIDALRLMEDHKPRPIYLLPVVDDEGRAVGLVHIHTLVQAGLASDRTR